MVKQEESKKKVTQKKVSKNKDKMVSFRLAFSDFEYLKLTASIVGMDVSTFVRAMCMSAINAAKLQEQEGKINFENLKAIQHDKL